jgi:hypothetical protein
MAVIVDMHLTGSAPFTVSDPKPSVAEPKESTATSASHVTEREAWLAWIGENTAQFRPTLIPSDFGLSRVAAFLDQSPALQLAHGGAESEAQGDFASAIRQLKAAYRLWPALDCIMSGGLPRAVREEAAAKGYLDDPTNVLLDVVDVQKARASRVVAEEAVCTAADVLALEAAKTSILATTTPLENNPENSTHVHKWATMMNNGNALVSAEPQLVAKLLQFAARAWDKGGWSDVGGPLAALQGGISNLSIRVMELWEYEHGGGLNDPYHYDVDSVLTIIVLLSESGDYDGGEFRTYEDGDVHKVYPMERGDAIGFVSHKYHNITELTRGTRRSLVTELWQGGGGHSGRR